jgi:hypothetical protein
LVRICENLIKIPLTTVFTESLPDCVMDSESDAAVWGGGRVNQGLNNRWNSLKFGGIGLVRIYKNLIKIPLTTVFE